jgi:hypothetical protein
MRIHPALLAIAALCLAPAVAAAASPQAPIVGQDVLGDKGRSGPDGWAQAPVTRNQAASGRAPGQTDAAIRSAPDAQPSGQEGKTLPRGQDPGAPAVAASGPGVLDAPAPAPKP